MNELTKENSSKTSTGAWIFSTVLVLIAAFFIVVAIAQNRIQSQNSNRQACLQTADDDYWSYVKLNATSSAPGDNGSIVYTAPQSVWDTAETNKQTAVNNCNINYPSQ